MKKIEAIINPSKIEEVKHALTQIGIRRMKISRVGGVGSQKGHREFYRANEFTIDVVEEFKIELTVTTDEMLGKVIDTIKKAIKTEGTVDEDIFVYPLEEVNQLRAGVHYGKVV